MKNSVGDRIRLHHIYDAILEIEKYTIDQSHEDFINKSIIQAACIRQLEIIGEATKNLSTDIRLKYPDIEWKKIAGMRDKLIHDYIGVDIWAVWEVIDKILPNLEKRLLEIIQNEKKDI